MTSFPRKSLRDPAGQDAPTVSRADTQLRGLPRETGMGIVGYGGPHSHSGDLDPITASSRRSGLVIHISPLLTRFLDLNASFHRVAWCTITALHVDA